MIERRLTNVISSLLTNQKVLLVYGARRVGKTVLIRQVSEKYAGKALFLNGEDASTEVMFRERTARIIGNCLAELTF